MAAVKSPDYSINPTILWLTPLSTLMPEKAKEGALSIRLSHRDNRLDRISESSLELDHLWKEKLFMAVSSGLFWMLARKTNPVASWNISVLRSLNENDRKIWIFTSISASGRALHSITYTTRGPLRNLSTKIPPNRAFFRCLKGTTPQFLLMVRRVQVRRLHTSYPLFRISKRNPLESIEWRAPELWFLSPLES